MRNRITGYVGGVILASALATALLYSVSPALPSTLLLPAVTFVVLGLLCHAYMYQFGRAAAAGTISFIPFLTAVSISPTWPIPLLIGLAVGGIELLRRAERVKGVFNVAQYTLAMACAAIAYSAFGGHSLHLDERFRVVPFGAMVLVFLALNTGAVSIAVAVSAGGSAIQIWRRNTLGQLPNDVLATPLIYVFALVYNRFALAGIVFLAFFLLGARQLYRTNRQLEQTNKELLEVMVAAIELRDPYTSGHSQRVSEYSMTIGRAIGLPRKEIDRLRIAALLHDVGKIDQRFAAILQKPGRLTDDERKMIELHSVSSEELVARVSGLADTLPAIRHHHERWDGLGYPDQLSGDSIPLFARIIAFADTIDAMATDRPYRNALRPSEIRGELLRNRGKQFDPVICDRLLASPTFGDLFGHPETASAPTDFDKKPVIAA